MISANATPTTGSSRDQEGLPLDDRRRFGARLATPAVALPGRSVALGAALVLAALGLGLRPVTLATRGGDMKRTLFSWAIAVGLVFQSVSPAAAYTLNIYQSSRIALQRTEYYCVPASALTWTNYINGTTDKSEATEAAYFNWGRRSDHSKAQYPTAWGVDPRGWAWIMYQYTPAGYYFNDYRYSSQATADKYLAIGLRSTSVPVGALVAAGKHAVDLVGFTADRDPMLYSSFTLQTFSAVDPWSTSWDDPGLGTGYPIPIDAFTISYWNSNYFKKYSDLKYTTYWNGYYVPILRKSGAAVPSDTPSAPYNTTMATAVEMDVQPAAPTLAAALETWPTDGTSFGSALSVDLSQVSIGRTVHVTSAINEHPSYDLAELRRAGRLVALALITEEATGFRIGAIRAVGEDYELPDKSRALDSFAAAGRQVGDAALVWGWSQESWSPFTPVWVGKDAAGRSVASTSGRVTLGLHLASGFTARQLP